MQIEDAKEDFLSYCKIEKGLVESSTVKSYQEDLKIFIQWLDEHYNHHDKNDSTTRIDFLVSHLNKTMVKEYLNHLGHTLSAKSMARHLTTIRQFSLYLVKEKELPLDITAGITPPKIGRKLPEVLNANEMEQLLNIPLNNAFDYRNKAMLELMYATGLRISELVKLTIFDLDFSTQLITIKGKGRKERVIPFGDYAKYYVERYLEVRPSLLVKGKPQTDILFLNNHGEGMTRQGFFKNLKKILVAQGIKKEVSPHTIRHSFATTMLKHGANLRVIQELLGHEDITTTKIYTHISNEKVHDDYKKHHLRKSERGEKNEI